MPFARPTLTELQQQAQQDVLGAAISGIDAFLRFSVLMVLTWVQAQMSWLHYEYLDWIARQAVPWTATDEFLAGWGLLKGVSKKQATAATSSKVSFAVTGTAIIPAGTTLTRSDGWTYATTADSVTASGVTTAPVTSTSTGSSGNAVAGTGLVLGSPVQGVQASGTLTTAATGGADIETDDDYRSRVIAAYQATGSDGREAEYIEWATAVSGVTRAWVNRNGAGAGSVVVYVMFDDAESATGGFPVGSDGAAASEGRYTTATGDQLTVANAIWPDQPVTALVIVASPIAQPVDFVITDLGTGNTTANQASITAALQDMFRRVSAPGGTVHPNQWEEAIAAISGLTQFAVSSPSGAVAANNVGSMPVFGTISFAS